MKIGKIERIFEKLLDIYIIALCILCLWCVADSLLNNDIAYFVIMLLAAVSDIGIYFLLRGLYREQLKLYEGLNAIMEERTQIERRSAYLKRHHRL